LAVRQAHQLWRAALAATAAFLLAYALRVRSHPGAHASLIRRAPAPLAVGDLDHDSLPDELEERLAARFAPIVVLHPRDATRPASIPWLLSRFGQPAAAQGGLPVALRPGSADPRDWTTYVHVYPRTDGGINVQYWFFYAFNANPPFFDHDADWEHVTVRVTAQGQPVGVYFAQHGDSSPGVFRAWGDVRRAADHPIVLSARGSHASYPDQSSVRWFDSVSRCATLDGCGDPIWRTDESGGLVNVGEPRALLGSDNVREALAFGGRWGADAHFPRSRTAPPGPFHQSGFVVDGFQ
jgi:Vacuolar protein sorting-associated protein 62